jgi:hypothetical protein
MSPDEAMTAKQWKSKKSTIEPVEVPSGNMARIRRKPLQVFIKAGLIPNDLLPIVKNAMKKGKVEIKADEIMEDMNMVTSVLDLIDIVVVECVAEPKVYPAPLQEKDRDDDKLYVDEVDWEDKQFVYKYALGAVADLETFRQQQEDDVEPVQSGKDVESAAV